MRAVRILLILAVVLGGIFIAADRIAVHYAESEAADRIRSSQDLSDTPEVSIKGFPFLTQVADRRLERVDISLAGITASAGGRPVRVTEVRAELSDVLIRGNFSSAVAARADGSARISYADLARSAPGGATVSWAGADRAAKNQVKVTGPLVRVLEGAGIPVPRAVADALGDRSVTVHSEVELTGGDTVRLRAESLPDLPVPGFDTELRRALDYELRIERLPVGLKLDRARVDQGGIEFSGTGRDVALVG
ncbi:DUF2993 domain-containing protein [Streptomyces sp. CAU 1734]|uniref:LmeA family phospholipid-binding protein n=1 Tax=Streptomyces sp. CAU 1734 TaxID=3140360 RepID=UPI003261781E